MQSGAFKSSGTSRARNSYLFHPIPVYVFLTLVGRNAHFHGFGSHNGHGCLSQRIFCNFAIRWKTKEYSHWGSIIRVIKILRYYHFTPLTILSRPSRDLRRINFLILSGMWAAIFQTRKVWAWACYLLHEQWPKKRHPFDCSGWGYLNKLGPPERHSRILWNSRSLAWPGSKIYESHWITTNRLLYYLKWIKLSPICVTFQN